MFLGLEIIFQIHKSNTLLLQFIIFSSVVNFSSKWTRSSYHVRSCELHTNQYGGFLSRIIYHFILRNLRERIHFFFPSSFQSFIVDDYTFIWLILYLNLGYIIFLVHLNIIRFFFLREQMRDSLPRLNASEKARVFFLEKSSLITSRWKKLPNYVLSACVRLRVNFIRCFDRRSLAVSRRGWSAKPYENSFVAIRTRIIRTIIIKPRSMAIGYNVFV